MPGCNIKNIHDETNDQLVDMRISVSRLDPLEGNEQLLVEKINTFAWGSVSRYNRLWLTDFLFFISAYLLTTQ